MKSIFILSAMVFCMALVSCYEGNDGIKTYSQVSGIITDMPSGDNYEIRAIAHNYETDSDETLTSAPINPGGTFTLDFPHTVADEYLSKYEGPETDGNFKISNTRASVCTLSFELYRNGNHVDALIFGRLLIVAADVRYTRATSAYATTPFTITGSQSFVLPGNYIAIDISFFEGWNWLVSTVEVKGLDRETPTISITVDDDLPPGMSWFPEDSLDDITLPDYLKGDK